MKRFDSRRLRSLFGALAALGAAHLLSVARTAEAVCVGDCDNDGRVRINEVQRCVNLAHGLASEPCANADQDQDGTVSEDEVDRCIQSFLDAGTCPQVAGTQTPTRPATNTRPPATSTRPPATSTSTPGTPARRTSTPTRTHTNTPVPTGTRTATAVPTAPPTATRTATRTPTGTSTSTQTPTNTPVATNTSAALGEHVCTLGGTVSESFIRLHAGLPLPPFATAGAAVGLSCGAVGGNGKAPCTCGVQSFPPLLIASIFWACVNPTTAVCPAGEVDCDGGNAMGLDMEGHRNIGPCTSNADCLTQCTALCAASGKQPFGAPFPAACEGFCTLGAQSACTSDAQCLAIGEGSCNGPDSVGFGHICDCTCVDMAAGSPGVPGELSCQLAFNLTVEPNPGNGVACDGGDVTINVGDTCAPVTTAATSGIITNANNAGAPVTFPSGGPFSASGEPANCAALGSSTTTGMKLGGAAAFYASTIGDILAEISATCE